MPHDVWEHKYCSESHAITRFNHHAAAYSHSTFSTPILLLNVDIFCFILASFSLTHKTFIKIPYFYLYQLQKPCSCPWWAPVPSSTVGVCCLSQLDTSTDTVLSLVPGSTHYLGVLSHPTGYKHWHSYLSLVQGSAHCKACYLTQLDTATYTVLSITCFRIHLL